MTPIPRLTDPRLVLPGAADDAVGLATSTVASPTVLRVDQLQPLVLPQPSQT